MALVGVRGFIPRSPGISTKTRAKVAELVDAPDLGSGAERCGGSSPPFRTNGTVAPAGTCYELWPALPSILQGIAAVKRGYGNNTQSTRKCNAIEYRRPWCAPASP